MCCQVIRQTWRLTRKLCFLRGRLRRRPESAAGPQPLITPVKRHVCLIVNQRHDFLADSVNDRFDEIIPPKPGSLTPSAACLRGELGLSCVPFP